MAAAKRSRDWKLNKKEREALFAYVGEPTPLAKAYLDKKGHSRDGDKYENQLATVARRFGEIRRNGTFTEETQEMVALTKGVSVTVLRNRLRPTKKVLKKSPVPSLSPFADYLDSVAEKCARLVTRGVPTDGAKEALKLASVYVHLQTGHPREANKDTVSEHLSERSISALDALLGPEDGDPPRQVVLTGEPGSGKSTFLQYVTLCLADQIATRAGKKSHLAQHQPPERLTHTQRLPLRIILRDFHREMPQARSAEHVLDYLRQKLSGHAAAIAALPGVLTAGRAWVLFDGLDEIPVDSVAHVRAAIESFADSAYGRSTVVVTCRVESWKSRDYKLPDFPPPRQLARFSPTMKDRFIKAWYEALADVHAAYQRDAEDCAKTLQRAVRSERLREMSGNPFFLTAMATLHRPDFPLPHTGAALMNKLVQCVLEESRRRDSDQSEGQLPEIDFLLLDVPDGFDRLRKRLEAIAYEARKSRPNAKRNVVSQDILENRLRLTPDFGDRLSSLIEALRTRAGILQCEDDQSFTFAHRFEEFLAGCHLANESVWYREKKVRPFPDRVLDLWDEQDEYARQVILWATGMNAHVWNAKHQAMFVIESLIAPVRHRDGLRIADLELAADIAGDMRLEQEMEDELPGAERVAEKLRTLLTDVRDAPDRFDPANRSRAGSAIGWLGDQRAHLDYQGSLDDFGWVRIAEGAFDMGDDDMSYCGNTRFRCGWIEKPFRITRFPVTVSQYDAFVQADGYWMGTEVWSAAGLAWRTNNGIEGPEDEDRRAFQSPNHPRVGISWYEADAYCRWLSRELGAVIRLPTEAEWERAARGTDARKFPWGAEDDWQARCANGETGLENTSPVGLFSAHDTPIEGDNEFGLSDMAGNVWEWCHTVWRNQAKDAAKTGGLDDPKAKGSCVLRGGSWFDFHPDDFRCAFRNHYVPDVRDYRIGFRCVRES